MKRYGPYRRAGSGCLLLVTGVAALPAAAEISITPRFGYYFDNEAQRKPENLIASPQITTYVNQTNAGVTQNGGQFQASDLAATKASQLALPQFGATVTFTLGGSGSTSLALTALYGKGGSNETVHVSEQYLSYRFPTGATFVDTITTALGGSSEFKRLDLETVVQYRLNETFSMLGGIRGERTVGDHDLQYTQTMSLNALNYLIDYANAQQVANGQTPTNRPQYIQSAFINEDQHASRWVYSVRYGVAAYVPVGDKHLLYANGLLHLNRNPGTTYTNTLPDYNLSQTEKGADTETTIGPDISVGYMYRIGDRFGIDTRYRASIYFPISGDRDFKDSRVRHGVMVGFTTWFGDR